MHAFSRRQMLACSTALAGLALTGLGQTKPALAQFLPLPGPLTPSDAAQPKDKGDTAALHAFFEEVFEAGVQASPQFQGQLGRKTNMDKWDDQSDAADDARLARTRAALAYLRANWDPARLPEAARLNVRVFEQQAERQLEAEKWRRHDYPLNHLGGEHTGLPTYLINVHKVQSLDDARAYLARLAGIAAVLDQVMDNARASAALGVIPPKFSFAKLIPDIRAVVTGAPFDDGPDSSLLADFKAKIAPLDIPAPQKGDLIAQARRILTGTVKPAYERLGALAADLQAKATDEDGVWKLPDGAAYYRDKVRQATTTELAPEAVHALGLEHVALLQTEMRGIMAKVGFQGDLQAFFQFVRTDERFFYPDTIEGRAAYIQQCNAVVDAFRPKLDELFLTKPKAPLVVKRVEAYREKSAPPAFYNQPALDGSRPGIFYAALSNMREVPKWAVDAVVYHEGIPGHHMQIAIAQELEDVPSFRKFSFFGAYIEGWGLYAERLPKEVGFYQDPYADFGRLNAQIWRAARLVVDTGLHAKRWTRQQAIDYMTTNTPLGRDLAEREVDRYIVSPGQATSYYVGMLKILELRQKAKTALGGRFDLRAFHDVVLRGGALPLSVLEETVDAWITRTRAA
ncbi:DUF885 domain-containing protein [Oleisolibacter albus]|uniref:DUF885 domain-containing protein n=1 Tax=Oleisolibacter albus TaxID=2171757 RepID=UPI00139052AD|nr:DUF885 domain-containing protein [Oleisolibacter albus]